jgi:hypothetical protein
MLEGLNRIDWGKLTHAYGAATDVPDLIRGLASQTKQAREAAIYELYGNIFHQGTRYQATAHAVPFLIELLESATVAGKDRIVLLLVDCATGYAEEYLPRGLDIGTWRAQLKDLPDENGKYLQWYLDAYEAVRRGVPTFVRLANEMDGEVRLAASYALAWFREDARTSIEVVRQRLEREHEPRLVANAALVLGLLAGYLGESESERLRALLASKDALIRQATAIALVTSLGPRAPVEAIQELIVALQAPAREELPWNGGDMLGYISKTLGSLGHNALDLALTPMLDALRRSTGSAALQTTGVLLQLLLPQGARGITAAMLTPQQRALLTALSESPRAWQFEGQHEGEIFANFSLMIARWGLPDSIEKMRAFLQG